MRRLALSAGAVLTLAISVLTAAVSQQSPQSSSDTQPTFKATTRIVNVNVVVTDSHGNPITGLTKEDFELFDRGEPQTIRFFDAINNVAPPPAEPLPPGTYTNQPATKGAPPSVTALIVDSQHSSWAARGYALHHLRAFLRSLSPDDRIALYLLADDRLAMLHDFTQDPSDLIAAIQRYDAEHTGPESQRKKQNVQSISAVDSFLAGDDIRFQVGQSATVRSGGIVTSLTDIARHLASAPGRKSLIWIYGGSSSALRASSLLPDESDLERQLAQRIVRRNRYVFPRNHGAKAFFLGPNGPLDPADQALRDVRAGLYSGDLVPRMVRLFNDNGIAVYPVAAQGLQTQGLYRAGGTEDLGFRNPSAGSRIGPLIQLDTRGAPPPPILLNVEDAEIQQNMTALAQRTGGRSFYNRNDLETGIEHALDDGRYSYELAYSPDHNDWRGEWRKIEVKLKDPDKYVTRPEGFAQEGRNFLVGGFGVHVLARGGYFAFPEPNQPQVPAFDQKMMSNLVQSSTDATDLPFLVRAVPLPDKDNPQIQLFLNLDAENLLVPQEGNHWTGNFELSFIQVVRRTPSNCCTLLTRSAPTLRNRPEVPPLRTRADVRERSQVPAKSYVLDLNEAEYQKAIETGMASTRTLKLQPGASMLVVVLRDNNSGAVGSIHIPLAQYTSAPKQ